ncbi:MAG: hypothetical protein JKX72_11955 [Robiginitomaculum sp.]|nr:hypothetical protein [Robiginitomaculum sp.]
MRLRSITKNIRDQNWLAVFLDFFIVVVGILLAFQITNWSERQSDKAEYNRALERLKLENTSNLKALDTLDIGIQLALQKVGQAFDILQSCIESEDNQEIVSKGIMLIQGTHGIHLRRKALEDLTTNSRLQAQQSPSERQRFTDMLFYFDLFLVEAHYAETIPLEELSQNNPIISIEQWTAGKLDYFGADFSRRNRQLVLNVPINQACTNNQLLKSFQIWERWQGYIPIFSKQLRKELETTQVQLETR